MIVDVLPNVRINVLNYSMVGSADWIKKDVYFNILSVAGVLIVGMCAIIISSFLTHNIHAQNNSILQITANKKTYNVGETVVITIKNTGKRTLEFSDSILGLTIQNTKNNQKAGLLGDVRTKTR